MKSIRLLSTFILVGLITVALHAGIPSQCTPLPPGLIGWWKGDGSTLDSVTGNSGVNQNITYTNGIVGQAFACDPENYQYIYTGIQIVDQPAYALTNSLTIEGWIRPRGDGYAIFWRGDNRPGLDPYILSMQGNNNIQFQISDENGNSAYINSPLDYDQWWHIAATLDGSSGVMSIYTNGVLAAQTTTTIRPFGDLLAGQSPGVGIGNVNDGQNNFPFYGDIDEISLYNRALTATEIQAIYNAGSAGKCPNNCTPSPSNIVAWWPAEGNALDQAGTNNGSLVGGVTYTNGEVGKAFAFNGTDSYILIPNSPSLNPAGGFSMEGWIYPTRDADQKILSKWGDQGAYANQRSYNFTIVTGLGLGFALSDAANQENGDFQNFTVNGVLTLNAWNHVAATYDSSNGIRNLYVNGINVGSFTNTPVAVYNSIVPLTIGTFLRAPGATQDYFQGLIDELSFYSRSLSDSEIQAIYNAGSSGKCNSHPYIPPPRTATATAEWAGKFVVGVDIIDGGAGYTNTPMIRFIGGGGTNAQASVIVSNGVVVAINITNPGNGYTNTPIVVIDPPFIPNPSLGIASVSMLNFSNLLVGTNYQLQQFQGSQWLNLSTGFKATNDFYTIMVSGVASSDSYRLAQLPVPVPATAAAQVINGFVVQIFVNNQGSGYITIPAVTISANAGSNATAVASITNGRVTSIAVTSAGFGYVNPVTVQIDPPPATSLSPNVTPGLVLNASNLAPYDNYQIQFKSAFGMGWGNLSGGLFIPTTSTMPQYLFLTNNTGYFRLQYLP